MTTKFRKNALRSLSFHFVNQARKERLPLEVYKSLVDQLFGTYGSFAAGVVCALIGGGMAWWHSGRTEFVYCLAAIVTASVVRCVILVEYMVDRKRRRLRLKPMSLRGVVFWETAYGVLGSWVFMLVVSSTAAVAVHVGDWVAILSCTLIVVGSAGAMAGRNAGRLRIVKGQVIAGLGPVGVALLADPDGYLKLVGVLVVLCAVSTVSYAGALALILKRALVDRFAVVKLAKSERATGVLFESALNNMSQGLCTVDDAGRVRVMNDRFSAMFGDLPRDGALARDMFGMIADRLVLNNGTRASFVSDAMEGLGSKGELKVTNSVRHYAFEFNSTSDGHGTVVTVLDETEAKRNRERIENLAHFDNLTGLPNRVTFHDRMRDAFSRSQESFGIISIDLDRFKEVNDTLGHAMGDRLLRAVAGRLAHGLRPDDMPARLGGDEFAVLVAPDEGMDLPEMARRIIKRLSATYLIEGHQIDIGASIGTITSGQAQADELAPLRAERVGDYVDELLRRVDIAMYEAKKLGRGIMVAYDRSIDDKARERQNLKRAMEGATERGEMFLEYQPIVDARNGMIVACEALVRWNHPQLGRVRPDIFIAIAEESGHIVTIGDWVMRRACLDAATWPEDVRIAVNLSPAQIRLSDVPEMIKTALRTSRLTASRLEVEITENVKVTEDDRTRAVIASIKSLGVKLALDDFGKEYSTLGQLNKLPIDKIKIDQAFVKHVTTDPTARAIVRAVASLAAEIDKSVVCEGVEKPEQVKTLLDLGATLMQGWHYSKSVPADVVSGLLREQPFRTVGHLKVVA